MQLRGGGLALAFTVREVLWTLTDSMTRTVVERFALTGPLSRSPVAVAAGVVVDRGRVLLGFRHPSRAAFPSVWDLPGGHVEPNESPRRALKRELREELGIDAVIDKPWHRLVDDDLGIDLSLWLIRQWRGDVTNLRPDEHQRLGWFAADDLGGLVLAHPSYVPLLVEALNR